MQPEPVYLGVALVAMLVAAFRGLLRLDLAAMLLLLSLLVPWRRVDGAWVGILDANQAFSGFGSQAVVMIVGIFVISQAMERTGAAEMVGARLLRGASKREVTLQLAILVGATLFSAFVSDTTTVLVWMPLLLAVCRAQRYAPSRHLMILAVAALLGGQWTLIGTRANVVVSDFLRSQTGEGLGFFAFTPVAALVWLASATWLLAFGRRLLPSSDAGTSLADRYAVKEYLTEVMISTSNDMLGRPLRELDVVPPGATLLGVGRGENSLPPSPWLVLQPGDVLIVQGRISSISELLEHPGVEVREEMKLAGRTLRSVDLRMVEAVVGPGSETVGRRLRELGLAERFQLSILALSRGGRPLQQRPLEERLHAGDSLLLVGHEEGIENLRAQSDLLVLEERAAPLRGSRKAWLVLGWVVLLSLASALGWTSPAVAVVAAAVGCVLTGCVAARDAYRAVDWRVVVLLGAMIPYGLALEETGTASGLAEATAGLLGDLGPHAILAGFLLVTVILTQVLENSAAAVVLAPVAFQLARSADANPVAFLLGMAICSSAGFATPVAHECTLLVLAPGGYRLRHFLLVGIPLALIAWVVTTLAVSWLHPL